MRPIRQELAAAIAVPLFAVAANAGSTVLFDNYFGPNNGTANGGPDFGYAPGYFGGPPHLAPVTQIANSFQFDDGDFYLDSVHATMMFVPEAFTENPVNDGVTMRIHADDAGRPGAILGAFSAFAPLETLTGGQGPVSTLAPILFDFSGQSIVVEGGQTYWLSVEAINNGFAVWGAALAPDSDPEDPAIFEEPGTYSVRVNSGNWQPSDNDRAAFRVTGTAVPAPGVAALLGLVGVCTLCRRRRA